MLYRNPWRAYNFDMGSNDILGKEGHRDTNEEERFAVC